MAKKQRLKPMDNGPLSSLPQSDTPEELFKDASHMDTLLESVFTAIESSPMSEWIQNTSQQDFRLPGLDEVAEAVDIKHLTPAPFRPQSDIGASIKPSSVTSVDASEDVAGDVDLAIESTPLNLDQNFDVSHSIDHDSSDAASVTQIPSSAETPSSGNSSVKSIPSPAKKRRKAAGKAKPTLSKQPAKTVAKAAKNLKATSEKDLLAKQKARESRLHDLLDDSDSKSELSSSI